MKLAPQNILKAALVTLERAILSLRNATYPGNELSQQAINDLADALHNIPKSLLNWDETKDLEEIRLFLKSFDRSLWPGESAPDLLAIFESELVSND